MLTLTKKENEPIICTLPNGEEIKIVVTKVNGNQAKLFVQVELYPRINLYLTKALKLTS